MTATRETVGIEQGMGTAPLALNGTGTGNGNGENDSPIADTMVWNFHLSGGYQSVMAARGAVLREVPRDNRTVIKVPRTDILESPLATVSPLKAEVRRRLDEIASESKAHVAVLNMEYPGAPGVGGTVLATANGASPTLSSASNGANQPPDSKGGASEASSVNGATEGDNASNDSRDASVNGSKASIPPTTQVSYGLETERMCELVLTGNIESVEIAKVRLLVMLDELVSAECHITFDGLSSLLTP